MGLRKHHYKQRLVEVKNRFKGLDLIEELWMRVHDIVQERGSKTIPKKKKCKEAKWLPEEALHIAVKSKGEKERYKHLNASSREKQEETRKSSSVIDAKT